MALTLLKFPNFLPSTFTSEAKKAEIRKDLIEARLGMAREYYEKMKANAKKQRRKDLNKAAAETVAALARALFCSVEDLLE